MSKRGFWLTAPYVAWMALMTLLPSTAACYAVRTVVVACMVAAASVMLHAWHRPRLSDLLWGIGVGLGVFAIWILPEQFDWPWYGRFFIVGEGGTAAVDQAEPWLLAVRLVGSAFVIAVAEELFFRKWLVEFAGFWWMVALFAIEHDRWLVGAIAGVAYGVLCLRRGLGAAIVAHVVTNLVLGLWVIESGQWQFW